MQSSLWKRELKRASFTFDRCEYKDLLCILKEGNDCLENLARYNKDMEPKRRRRFDLNYLGLLRSVSDNVFRALQNSLSCSCNHGLGLELHPPKARLSRQVWDHESEYDFPFRVGISETKSSGRCWKEFQLTPLIGTPKNITVNMAGVPTSRRPPQIVDLCSTVLRHLAETPPSYHGFISTREVMDCSTFEVNSPPTSKGPGCDLITLDRILRDDDGFVGKFSYTQKLRLVYSVSYAVLQLSERSWLADSLSSKDIIFLRENESIDYQRVFIGRGIFDQNPPPIPSKKAIGKRSSNHTLLALAILLIEIMLQGPFERLRESMSPWIKATVRDARSDLDAAQALATRVNNEFGSRFGSAIRHCIYGDFDCGSTSLEDEDFRQEFYAGVVVLLEENIAYAGLA